MPTRIIPFDLTLSKIELVCQATEAVLFLRFFMDGLHPNVDINKMKNPMPPKKETFPTLIKI